jgi:hypothetical protein
MYSKKEQSYSWDRETKGVRTGENATEAHRKAETHGE